jgi:hypothetical protein
MKRFDRLCAAILFVTAIVDSLLVPRTYTGRIWIFGTILALLFTCMLNVLRIRNSHEVRGLKLSCITANVTMFVLAIALMASIGKARTLQHPQVPLVAALLLAETVFSLAKPIDFDYRGRRWRGVSSEGSSACQEKRNHRRTGRRTESFPHVAANRWQGE